MSNNEHEHSVEYDLVLRELLRQYVAVSGVAAKRRFLQQHPELFAPAAEEVLSDLCSIQRSQDARAFFERVRSELKDCREHGIELALPDEPPARAAEAPLVGALSALMAAGSLEAMKGIVSQHPELLGPEADAILRRTSDVRTARHLEHYRRLLEKCRQVGVDAAFAEVERRTPEPALATDVIEGFLNVLAAKSLVELEHSIRCEPRVVQGGFRALFAAYLSQNNFLGVPAALAQQRLGLLEECERRGIDFAIARLAGSRASNAGATDAFNRVIHRFNNGHNPAEIWQETTTLIPLLPELPRRSCMVLAIVAGQRAGQHARARELAMQLSQEASGWDLPGLPTESLGVAVSELRDVSPVVEALDSMLRVDGVPSVEQAALGSLRRQYAQRLSPPIGMKSDDTR